MVAFTKPSTSKRLKRRVLQLRSRPGSFSPSKSTCAQVLVAFANQCRRFKPEKEGDSIQYTGLSQSAIREMSLCTELEHPNLVHLVEIILQDKCVFMVFEYCEHDLLQIIHHHLVSFAGSSAWCEALHPSDRFVGCWLYFRRTSEPASHIQRRRDENG